MLSFLYCDLFSFNILLSTILLSLFLISNFSNFYTKDQWPCQRTLPTSHLPHTIFFSFLLYFTFIVLSLFPLCYWLTADLPQLKIFNQHPPPPFLPFHEKDRHCKHEGVWVYIYIYIVCLSTTDNYMINAIQPLEPTCERVSIPQSSAGTLSQSLPHEDWDNKNFRNFRTIKK